MKKYDFVPEGLELETEDGWMLLLEDLLDKIQELVDKNPKKYEKLQLKSIEKIFGMLFVTFEPYFSDVEVICGHYSSKSIFVCEKCGGKATLKLVGGEIVPLCKKHYKSKGE